MGFGWLFMGYFMIVMNIPMFGLLGTVVRLCGIGFFFAALLKLRKYNNAFNITIIGAALMSVVSLALLALNIHDVLFEQLIIEEKIISDGVKNVIGYTEQGASFIFNSLMLWGIYKIAKETEVSKLYNGAIRNFIFVCFYYFVYALSFLPTKGIQSVQSEFALIAWILYFVFVILNLILLFSSYVYICDESDIDMERKPSKFEFINRFNERFDEKAQKAQAEDEAYRRERAEKRAEKKRRKKK